MVPRVYILGAGAVGSLVTHELAQLSVESTLPQVVLLLRNPSQLEDFLNNESKITIKRTIHKHHTEKSVQLLAADSPPVEAGGAPSFIGNLIISTKAQQTESAIHRYIPNLGPNSNILLLQNGMGVIENLYEKYWPENIEARPNFYQGIITHGIFKESAYKYNHAGFGDIKIAPIPKDFDNYQARADEAAIEIPEMIDLLQQSNILKVSWVSYSSLILAQAEKLIINACINPLTALFDCNNGSLLFSQNYLSLIKPIIKECVKVLFASSPILLKIPVATTVLSEQRLVNVVLKLVKDTENNYSSMNQDMKFLRETEISNINGYILRQGKKSNIFTPYNYMITKMVQTKLDIEKAKDNAFVKFAKK